MQSVQGSRGRNLRTACLGSTATEITAQAFSPLCDHSMQGQVPDSHWTGSGVATPGDGGSE